MYTFLKAKIALFAKSETGASAIEYGLIAGLIAVVILVAVGGIGESLGTFFGNACDELAVDGGGTCS